MSPAPGPETALPCCNLLEPSGVRCLGTMAAGWPEYVCDTCSARCGAQAHPQHSAAPTAQHIGIEPRPDFVAPSMALVALSAGPTCLGNGHYAERVTYQGDDMLNPETLPGIRWRHGWIVVDAEGHYELVHDRSVLAPAAPTEAHGQWSTQIVAGEPGEPTIEPESKHKLRGCRLDRWRTGDGGLAAMSVYGLRAARYCEGDDRWEARTTISGGPVRTVTDQPDPAFKPRPVGFTAKFNTEPQTWEGDNA